MESKLEEDATPRKNIISDFPYASDKYVFAEISGVLKVYNESLYFDM